MVEVLKTMESRIQPLNIYNTRQNWSDVDEKINLGRYTKIASELISINFQPSQL